MILKSQNHLQENKMTYGQHFLFAFGHGLKCLKAGIYLLCHAFIPAIFQKAGSTLVKELDKSFTDHKIAN